jgi:predicted GNAT family N-acyltransferase
MGITHLFYVDNELAGYVTLAMSSISIKQTRLRLGFFDKKVRYPALLLGRVGVSNNFRKRNVGRCMCLWSIGLAKKLSTDVGCRFVVLLTQSEHRVTFYKKCGFEVCELDSKKKEKMMYFQLF